MPLATSVVVALIIILALLLGFIARVLWVFHEQSPSGRLRQVRKGARVHLPTDPVCRLYTGDPAPGSRLHAAASGWPCPICDPDTTPDPNPWS